MEHTDGIYRTESGTEMVLVADMQDKIVSVMKSTKDDFLMGECQAWLETCAIMDDLGLKFLTMERNPQEH